MTAAIESAREATRDRILQVALELFAERGFAGTSTRELSERLGFTKAALYYHFRTKDELLTALLGPALDGLEALVSGLPARATNASRRELLRGFVDLLSAHAPVIRVLVRDPSIGSSPAVAELARRAKALFDLMARHLADTDHPGTAELTRVRVAVGGINTAMIDAEPADDPDVVRATALAAACGALGLPPRRTGSAA